MYVYIYIYTYVCMYVCMYVYREVHSLLYPRIDMVKHSVERAAAEGSLKSPYELFRGNHLSKTICITHFLLRSGE